MGQGNPKELYSAGVTPDNLLWHFNLRNEYILTKLRVDNRSANKDSSAPVTHIMTVLDVKGIKVSDITTDVLRCAERSVTSFLLSIACAYTSLWAVLCKSRQM